MRTVFLIITKVDGYAVLVGLQLLLGKILQCIPFIKMPRLFSNVVVDEMLKKSIVSSTKSKLNRVNSPLDVPFGNNCWSSRTDWPFHVDLHAHCLVVSISTKRRAFPIRQGKIFEAHVTIVIPLHSQPCTVDVGDPAISATLVLQMAGKQISASHVAEGDAHVMGGAI